MRQHAFVSEDNICRIVEHGQDRLLVVHDPGGFYRLRHQRRYRSEYEGELISEGWKPMPPISSFFDDPDAAEEEARRIIAAMPS